MPVVLAHGFEKLLSRALLMALILRMQRLFVLFLLLSLLHLDSEDFGIDPENDAFWFLVGGRY